MLKHAVQTQPFIGFENHNIAIAMSSYCADPMPRLNILHGLLESFKCLILTTNERFGSDAKWCYRHTDTQTHTQTLTQPFIVKDIYRIYHVKITPSVQNVLLETYIE